MGRHVKMVQPGSLYGADDPFHWTMMNMNNVQRLVMALAAGLISLNSAAWAGTHAWLPLMKSTPPTEPISQRYEPPNGYHRVAVEPHSFAEWLRKLPIRTDRVGVRSYQDVPLNRPSAGIVAIDVGDRDLMQCADSIIRLHAEYLWANGRQNEAAYRFTSGDETRWSDWVSGEHFRIDGSGVTRIKVQPRTATHTAYRRWLDLVFTYAGTRSLARDAARPSVDTVVEPGEFYVDAGSPGHAVIVLDVVTNTNGVRLGLLGQGFMPAEDIHVLRSSLAIDGVWFRLPAREDEALPTPSWKPFGASSRRRLH